MADSTLDAVDEPARTAWIFDPKVRSIVYQLLMVSLLVWLGYEIVSNTAANLQKQKIASGLGFLDNEAGFGIIQSLIHYTEDSSYGTALLVGGYNTLLIAFIGIVFATVFGFIIGIARLSSNWVISRVATVYIEIVRNVPLLLQIFFWYFAVLRAVPGKQEKWSLFDTFHLNITGFTGPRPVFEDGSAPTVIAFFVALALAIAFATWAKRNQMQTGQQFPVFKIGLGLVVVITLLVFFATGRPIHWDYPVFTETGPVFRRGFKDGTGFLLIPEFLALLLALALYTAAFIAEIVRAGILAVPHGQSEASQALGLQPGQTLRLVIIPQAMRVIIPPLTSQYLNLTKNSSLAVAIAYPDLVSVGGTILNQTGQAVEIISIWMLVYLSISLLTSLFMNWFNKRMALVER